MGFYLEGSAVRSTLLPRGEPRKIVVLTIVSLEPDKGNILRQILVLKGKHLLLDWSS